MENKTKIYSHCDVQLNLFSLMKISALVGMCGGVSWALIIWGLDLVGFIELERFKNYMTNFVAFPLLGGFFGALFALVGYPIYDWICKNNSGLIMRGIFHEPRNSK